MAPIILAFLLAPDAWVGPSDTAGPGSPSVQTIHAYTWANNTGHSVNFGGPGNSPYSVKETLSRSVVVFQHNYQGWGEPGWTTFFATLGDFSVSRYVTADPNHITTVPDGSTYFHDIKIHTATNYEEFTGGTVNPGADAVRKRSWQTSDPSEDSEYSQSGPGGPPGS